jgi:hypothetical protein
VPPNALLLACLLLAPTRRWWLLILAAFPAHLLAELQGGVPVAMVLCWFVSNVVEALIGALFVRRFTGSAPAFASGEVFVQRTERMLRRAAGKDAASVYCHAAAVVPARSPSILRHRAPGATQR